MFQFNTTITGADLSPRAAKKALREAEDFGLLHHRRRFMKHHFTKQAHYRYGGDYKKRGKAHRGPQQRNTDKRHRPNAGRRMKRGNKQPLVRTGLLKQKILFGGVKHTGRYDKRKLKYSPPYYVFISAYGQIDKKAALNAVNDSEKDEVVKVTEKRFHENLQKRKTTKRG